MFLPLVGVEVGMVGVLNALTFVPHHAPSWELLAVQPVLAHGAYGLDRLVDSLYAPSEKEVSRYITENRKQVITTVAAACSIGAVTLQNLVGSEAALAFLGSTVHYRDIKKALPFLKPLFVAACLISASVILPGGDQPENWIPPFLNMFCASTLQDIKDTEEDRKAGINTIPVVLGANTASYLAIFCGLIAGMMTLPRINDPYIALFEIQNSIFLFQCAKVIKTDER